MSKITLPYPGKDLEINLPRGVTAEVLAPREVSPPSSAADEINSALNNPLGAPSLENLARPGQRVALIIDDVTRQTPTALLLEHILPRLHGAGVSLDDISIVVALGTHRPLTSAEIREKVGPDISRTYRIHNDPCSDESALVFLGQSSGGIPVWVHRAVAKADLRIGVGMITPHLDAGFGGGAKIVLPGVCGKETIERFHSRLLDMEGNPLGRPEAGLRLELEDFVQENVPLNFILNVVLDRQSGLYRAVAGHPLTAHRTGARHALEVYGVPFEERLPLVIANAHPHHRDFWQATKGLAGGELMTAPGGSLILLAACPEGMGEHPLLARYLDMELDELLTLIRNGKAEDQVAAVEAVVICRLKKRLRLSLVSEGVTPEQARQMGMTLYADVEQALAGEITSGQTKVGILTHGGSLVPILS